MSLRNLAWMSTLILGANSMMGWTLFAPIAGVPRDPGLVGACSPRTRMPKGSGLRPLDMVTSGEVKRFLEEVRPKVVIHCAAICKVEKCERHPDYAWDVNVGGTLNLLRCLPADVRLVYCSSDHVFSGDTGPYTEDSTPDPISYYGETRVESERLVLEHRPDALVIRVPLCIGPSYNGRSGHFDWLRYRCGKGLPMTIVQDEFRSAMPTDAAARRILEMVDSDLRGIRHLQATRVASRPALAEALSRRQGLEAVLKFETRSQRRVPHLGRVEMQTVFADNFAAPIPSVLD